MSSTRTRLAAMTAASLLGLGIVACGGGEAPTAASCADKWNADANANQQATLAGVLTVDVLVGDKFRVGTWPKGEQKVSVTEGFTEVKRGRPAVVQKDSCVVLLPDSRLGQMAFVEANGKWGFVRGKKATFPEAASESVAGARFAEPDVLGKLKLEGGGER